MTEPSEWQCCFCGEVIRGENPVVLTIELEDHCEQALWSHQACLETHLHPSVPRALG